MALIRGVSAVVCAAVVAAAAGCGSSAPPVTAAPQAEIERPRDTAQIAEAIAGGRVGALLYMDRFRASPLAKKFDDTFHYRAFWEGTGIDPDRDVDRIFASAPSLDHPERGVWVTQVNVPLTKMRSAIDVLFKTARVKGAWVDGAPRPEADVELRDGSTRRLALVEPRFVVMVPKD
ncbi:MAG TPA: hypothetical protein VHB21_24605, partial [Minicystis sp.]|nr:hypothetical protein [Minicystis sp.]